MDFAGWLLLIAFEGIIGGVAVLLSLTYISFARMEKDVRRARMFIMADRIQRFLAALTIGFVVLAVTFAGSFLGIVLPTSVTVGAFFFFLATIAYGIAELYFIVRPRRSIRPSPLKTVTAAIHRRSSIPKRAPTDPLEDELDASR